MITISQDTFNIIAIRLAGQKQKIHTVKTGSNNEYYLWLDDLETATWFINEYGHFLNTVWMDREDLLWIQRNDYKISQKFKHVLSSYGECIGFHNQADLTWFKLKYSQKFNLTRTKWDFTNV